MHATKATDKNKALIKARTDAVEIFRAGINAVAPEKVIKASCSKKGSTVTLGRLPIDLTDYRRIYVIGAGKATAPMAAAMEALLGERITGGIICVKYGHVCPLETIRIVEAGHPVPDQNGVAASRQMLEIAGKAEENDLVICLISGGGSALLPRPAEGITLDDKQKVTEILLACGATIHEFNAIRKHLSAIKGGQLAVAAYPATLVSLVLSDVVGDDLDVIASGPTVPDGSTYHDCIRIVEKYQISGRLPQSVRKRFQAGIAGRIEDTPKHDLAVFAKTHTRVIGSNLDALKAAETEAEQRGYSTLILSSLIEGEAEQVAKLHTAVARQVQQTGHPISAPACILSGGEATVTLKGNGKGGRNQEFVLCCVKDIAGPEPVVLLSGGTDGNDGPTDAAGAIADHLTLERASQKNLKIDEYLQNNDSYHFFQHLDDLIVTGPTNTNVMDIRLLLIPGHPELQ